MHERTSAPSIGGIAAFAVAAALCGACGSNSPSSSPSSPSPTPAPNVAACTVISASSIQSPRIVNGSDCSTATSSVVLLDLRDKDGVAVGSCSGTVIASRAVLTAAHCLLGDTGGVRIYPGTGSEIAASSFRAYPSYRESDLGTPDVGIVIASQDLPRAAVHVLFSRAAQVGETAVIAGWGKDAAGTPTVLRAGTTTVSAAGVVYLQTQYSDATSSVCQGDSGGPLLVSQDGIWSIAGVTSGVTQSGSCTAGTNYYSNVHDSDAMSFIQGLVPDAARQ